MAILNVYGSITNVDDGTAGISAVSSNENHTFTADAMGVISDGDLGMFVNDIAAFVGTTQFQFTTGSPNSGEFSIGTLTALPLGNDLVLTGLTVNGFNARLVVTDGVGTTGFADADTINSVLITLPLTFNIAGTARTINQTVTLSKSIGGSAPLVTIAANTNTVAYNSDNTIARTQDIVFIGASENIAAGDFTWSFGHNGNAPTTPIGNSGTISGTNDNTLTFTAVEWAAFISTNTTTTIRDTRNQRSDQTTVAILTSATDGLNISGRLEIASGNPFFRNGVGSVSFRIDVQTNGVTDSTALHDTYQYTWLLDGVTNHQGIGAVSRIRTYTNADIGSDVDMSKLILIAIDTTP